MADVRVATVEVVAALSADDAEANLAALGLELLPPVVRRLADVRVEGAGQATVAREDDEHDALRFPTGEQWVNVLLRTDARSHAAQHLVSLKGVGTKALDVLLRLPQASAGDQLHGAGDLLRALDASDALSNVLEVCHRWLVLVSLLGLEDFAERLESVLKLAFERIVDLPLRDDVGEDRSALGLEVGDELLLVAADRSGRKRIQEAMGTCEDRNDLLFDRPGYVLTLLEHLDETLTTRQLLAGGCIEIGSELRERGHLAVLRELETKRPGDLLHRLDLRVTADTRHRDADVDRGADA